MTNFAGEINWSLLKYIIAKLEISKTIKVAEDAKKNFTASIKVECLIKPAYVLNIKKNNTFVKITIKSLNSKYKKSNELDLPETENKIYFVIKSALKHITISNNNINHLGK